MHAALCSHKSPCSSVLAQEALLPCGSTKRPALLCEHKNPSCSVPAQKPCRSVPALFRCQMPKTSPQPNKKDYRVPSRHTFWHEVCPPDPEGNHMHKGARDTNHIPWMGKTDRGLKAVLNSRLPTKIEGIGLGLTCTCVIDVKSL